MSLESGSAFSYDKGVVTAASFDVHPLPGATFGGLVRCRGAADARAVVMAAEAQPEALPGALYASQGLLLLPGMHGISEEPELLVRLSRLFGTEVENYRETLTAANMIHDSVAEIFLVSNMPPANRQPPAPPDHVTYRLPVASWRASTSRWTF